MKVTCATCGKKCKAQGLGAHMKVHKATVTHRSRPVQLKKINKPLTEAEKVVGLVRDYIDLSNAARSFFRRVINL